MPTPLNNYAHTYIYLELNLHKVDMAGMPRAGKSGGSKTYLLHPR